MDRRPLRHLLPAGVGNSDPILLFAAAGGRIYSLVAPWASTPTQAVAATAIAGSGGPAEVPLTPLICK
jgi:hypothetical protein